MPYTANKENSVIHPVDLRVGVALRQRRISLSISQKQLAKTLGITFQQIQKYEYGTNRISASRLYELSVALKVPVTYFYELVDTGRGCDDDLDIHLLPKKELVLAHDLAKADERLVEVVTNLLALYRETTTG
ncbi:MAG: helix-turn-helix domain-containing protein [Alphaproteobacteria bacterium]|nr:helix-turn-helix domain-containing protein [Rhodospirillales bacterium]MCW9045666.1 helix-turn-helix domain-containing protein [Alphaproteobacteria bacterium]